MTTITIFGDSIAQGVMDIKLGGWANRLMVFFWDKWDEYHANVYTLGVSAETSKDIIERFDNEAGARKPNIVIFAFGTNDAGFFENGSVQTTEEQFKINIRQLITKARAYTDRIVFVGLTPVYGVLMKPFGGERSYNEDRTKLFDTLIQEACEEESVKYISVYDTIDKQDLSDGLHPNSAGHKKMFERIRDFLVEDVLESN